MYLKSMQQFTEALAKMNLPIDKESKLYDSGGNDSTKLNGKESKGEAKFVLDCQCIKKDSKARDQLPPKQLLGY
ncbi:hypothetical protein Tco_1460401 [Tanacetum coccineum]